MGKTSTDDRLQKDFAEVDRRLDQMDSRLKRLEDRLDTAHYAMFAGAVTVIAALLTLQLT